MITAVQDGKDPVHAQTNGAGSYTLELEAGEYRFTFSHEDYDSSSGTAAIQSKETVIANAELEKVRFPLTVTVSDQMTGEAIDGAAISVQTGEVPAISATTGSDGSCVIKLPNGEYSLKVTAENYKQAAKTVTIDGAEAAVHVQLAPILAKGYCGDGTKYYDVQWELSADGVMTVSGSAGVRYAEYYDLSSRSYHPYAEEIKALVIEESVTYANYNAFRELPNLETVSLPNGFTSIGSGTFYGCTSLKSIDLSDTLTTIEENAFWKCTSLTSVSIPDSVTSLGESAFSSCSSLQYARLSNSLTFIDDAVFNGCSGLVSVKLPVSLKEIHSSAFSGCTSLVSIDLPDTLSYIGESAFYRCSSLTEIRIPAVRYIGESAFAYTDMNLVWIDPDSTLSDILMDTFYDCDNLKVLYLPASLKSIDPGGLNQSLNSDHELNPSTVTHVYYGGTEDDWSRLKIYSTWSNAAGVFTSQFYAVTYFDMSHTVVTLNWKG